MREQSYEEEAFLREYCHQHHIDIYIKRLDLSDIVADGNSIQQEARQRRYEWFGYHSSIKSRCIVNSSSS